MVPTGPVVHTAGSMLSDLLKWGGKRLEPDQAGRPEVCLRRAPIRPSSGPRLFPSFSPLLPPSPRQCSSTSVPSSGPTSSFSASDWAASCSSKTSSLISIVTRAPARSMRSRASSTRGSVMRTQALTASCAGTSSISWTRPRRRRSPGRSSAWCARGAPSWVSSAPRPRPTTCPSLSTEIVDDNNFRHRLHPGVGGVKRAVQNRDIIRMFDGLVVSDSFLLKSNIREMLLRRR